MKEVMSNMRLGYKLVQDDFTSYDGFVWPVSGEVVAASPDLSNYSACPFYQGDGLCIALTLKGALSAGWRPRVLWVAYAHADQLGFDVNKVRVSRCWVLGSALLADMPKIWRGADLRCAPLERADLSNADLSNADLSYADLRWANLADAKLGGANLFFTDLWYANLVNADLSNAALRSAHFYGADLSGAIITNPKIQRFSY